jgi:CDP-glucose 4,6-dehydratase
MVNTKDKLSSYKDKKVFLTGHTGFKGSWMAKWLLDLGAIVKGYSLAPCTKPSHFELLDLDMESVIGDIRDKEFLNQALKTFEPDIVFHLAAQPLVRYSYENPAETYEVNVIGTLNLFEAIRGVKSVKAVVNVTTDKCYKNKEWDWGYRENDELGGYDPYSSSKACSELLTDSYRNSFFNLNDFGTTHNCLIATARAGNVIGGGDWSKDRIIPDIVRSKVASEPLHIRNPGATRPWQHVLEPISGYLALGYHLLKGDQSFACPWNLGPETTQVFQVKDIVDAGNKIFSNALDVRFGELKNNPHEAGLLMLDPARANKYLGWKGIMNFKETVNMTFNWYQEYDQRKSLNTGSDIKQFTNQLK